jgi:hypothetical protein
MILCEKMSAIWPIKLSPSVKGRFVFNRQKFWRGKPQSKKS